MEVQVHLDPARMETFGVSVAELRNRIQAANLDVDAPKQKPDVDHRGNRSREGETSEA